MRYDPEIELDEEERQAHGPNALLKRIDIAEGEIRVLPLGGLGEIGMNCMILESKEEIILIDCGVMFSDLDHFGIEFVIPDFRYLLERADKVKAVILTHGHEDHVGALAFLMKAGIRAPFYASPFTTLMIRERMIEHGLLDRVELRTFQMGDRFGTKDFKVQTTSVNHSIVDAAALIIDTPAGKVIHTGDFKIDANPFFGTKMDENVFKKAGDEGVLLLLSDSTNVERHECTKSEQMIYSSFDKLFAAAEGLTMVALFSSNVARVAQVFDIARKQGRKVSLCGRSMEQNVRLAQEAGYIKDVSSLLIPNHDIDLYDRDQVIVLTTGTQGEYRAALHRVAMGEHSAIQLQEGDRVLMSSRVIPGNEKPTGRMINNLFKQGADVLYEATHDIHVSGHASRPELKQMLEWTRPKFFLPIHGEYRHLVHHAELGAECGIPDSNILVATNGTVIHASKDRFEVVYEMDDEPRTFIDGAIANEISRDILRDRRKLAETGSVFVLMTREPDTGNVVAGPEIVFKGVATPEMENQMLEKGREVVQRIIREHQRAISKGDHSGDLAEEIRVELRRMYHAMLGKKPFVVPFILDL